MSLGRYTETRSKDHPNFPRKNAFEDFIYDQIKQIAGVEPRYEDIKIEYIGKVKTYIPDFILPNGIIIEAKGYFESGDRAKHLLIKQQHPELDIRFVFTNPRCRLNKHSQTTYGDWCIKNGFKFAKGAIPQGWFYENEEERKQ
jgi:hypothetical protein